MVLGSKQPARQQTSPTQMRRPTPILLDNHSSVARTQHSHTLAHTHTHSLTLRLPTALLLLSCCCPAARPPTPPSLCHSLLVIAHPPSGESCALSRCSTCRHHVPAPNQPNSRRLGADTPAQHKHPPVPTCFSALCRGTALRPSGPPRFHPTTNSHICSRRAPLSLSLCPAALTSL